MNIQLETNYTTLLTLLKDYARDVAFPLHFLRFTYEKLRKNGNVNASEWVFL